MREKNGSATPTDPDEAEYDPTADKYDFLIVFKNPKDQGVGGAAGSLSKGDAESAERISWQEVYDIWFQSDDDGLSNVQAHHVVTISTVQAHPWSMNWSR